MISKYHFGLPEWLTTATLVLEYEDCVHLSIFMRGCVCCLSCRSTAIAKGRHEPYIILPVAGYHKAINIAIHVYMVDVIACQLSSSGWQPYLASFSQCGAHIEPGICQEKGGDRFVVPTKWRCSL